jgi:predicted metalloprotease with PDZ domain
MVREYARHVQEFAAATVDGQPLPWHKTDKTTWRVDTGGADRIRISYKVYAYDLTVRTSHLDSSHGYFNPTTICMYVPGRLNEPHGITVVPTEGWRVTSGLSRTKDGGQGPEVRDQGSGIRSQTTTDEGQTIDFEQREGTTDTRSGRLVESGSWSAVAVDYDELVDTPFECGTHRVLSFEVDGIPHDIALWGRGNENEAQLIADTQKIVETARDMFGSLPYDYYVFIVHLSDGRGGGLEHRNSVSMLVDRWIFQPQSAYERYLGLTAHEFYHVWNVKRIRPAPLGPFDYSQENYTRQLWTMEGITSYYTDLLLLRAGLITAERYLELLSEKIIRLQSQPGRAIQSLETSSFDAWIKFYRSDENTINSAISYYLKGELVALLLDLEIRHRTNGAWSLDDVQRYVYEQYPISGPGFPEPDGYRAAVEAVIGAEAGSFADMFARYIAGTDELDYDRALEYVGLQLDWEYKAEPTGEQPPAWLGAQLKTKDGVTTVTSVRADSPAYTAGIYAGDELLALDGFRINEEKLNARLAERMPGDSVTISLFRRDEMLHIPVTLTVAPHDKLAVVPIEAPTEEQRARYVDWLKVGVRG